MKKVCFFIFFGLLAVSCKTHRVVQPVVAGSNDTVVVVQLLHDSVHIHDSIFEYREMKADTAYIYKYVQKVEYRDRLIRDSIYVSKVDSIPVPYPVEVEVPAKLSTFQKIGLWVGYMCMLWGFSFVVPYIICLIRKYV